jgi:hypothetical protein
MQSLLITICIINSTLLILHEIESAYENEWNILHLPGKISFFLILHIPILLVLFYCPIGLLLNTKASTILSASIGMAGVLPFLVHKVFVYREDAFNRPVSNILIYSNALTGVFQTILSILLLMNT